jgi:hypothetical protein
MAKVERCQLREMSNGAKKGRFLCRRHRARFEVKRCSFEGCTNIVVKGGDCRTHGTVLKRCSYEGCTNQVVNGGVCIVHGAKTK